jgi:6-phosphofructokinase
MSKLNGAIVVHGGGPTAVLNASLAGVIAEAGEIGVGRLWGARFGLAGLLSGDWIDLGGLRERDVERLRRAPASLIGSSRRKLELEEAERLPLVLKDAGIDAVLYTGGNGSMGTALEIHRAAVAGGYPDLRVVGIPKTIDNDLACTDHSPGYGSAARFFAHALRDIGADYRALPPPVGIVEVLGRNTGWIVGATALARARPGDPPHLIYLPERPPSIEKICEDIVETHRNFGFAVVAVCEGLRDPSGEPFGAYVDRPGSRKHELAANLGHVLARAITERTGLRARAEKPGLLGRSSMQVRSPTDAWAADLCGREAVRAAADGATGVMVSLRRVSGKPYRAETALVALEDVAGVERRVPPEWIAGSGSDVTPEFLDYVRPLAGPVSALARLKRAAPTRAP